MRSAFRAKDESSPVLRPAPRSASIGSVRVANHAGAAPNTIPVISATPNAKASTIGHHRRGARVDRQKGRACEGAYTDVRVSQGGPIRENLTQGDRQVAIVTAIGAEPAKHADIRMSCRRSGLLHVSPIGRLTRRLTPAPRSAKRAQLYRLSKLPGGSRCAPLRCVEGS